MSYKIKGTTVINGAGAIESAQEKIITNSSLTLGPTPPFQGTVSGYTSGGWPPPTNTIDKFSFSSDVNAFDTGDLSISRGNVSGQSSNENGYTSGGTVPRYNTIDKFPFAADANATDVGDLTLARRGSAGQQV